LTGKPVRQWQILRDYFIISLVGSIFVPLMTLEVIDKGVQASWPS
jgi:hypothetical protein